MTVVYETVGAIDRGAVASMDLGGDMILVDDGDGDLLLARPREGGDDE